jgi:hypothetical protein
VGTENSTNQNVTLYAVLVMGSIVVAYSVVIAFAATDSSVHRK